MSEELSVEAAKAELAQIDAWLNSLSEMQKQHQRVVIRAGFLQGFLAGKEDPAVVVPDVESPEPTPAPAPPKKTIHKSASRKSG